MKKPKELQWITAGYALFSQKGTNGLNIEWIARSLDKNKSSFYHYFGNAASFEIELLDYHLQRVKAFAELARACEYLVPDVLNLFIERKEDFFFHKQLRLHRENPNYKFCYEKAFKIFEGAFLDKWTDYLGLNHQPLFASTFLQLIAENFLLRITTSSFDYNWLAAYLQEVHT
ncbi:MAG: TetR/AcrR family transcriptional regulator, partial [Bacteroidota bacterium]